jgi:hypothetical protein
MTIIASFQEIVAFITRIKPHRYQPNFSLGKYPCIVQHVVENKILFIMNESD